ncbi:hypothetical protein SLA2020_337650 [Shorea laevis]
MVLEDSGRRLDDAGWRALGVGHGPRAGGRGKSILMKLAGGTGRGLEIWGRGHTALCKFLRGRSLTPLKGSFLGRGLLMVFPRPHT